MSIHIDKAAQEKLHQAHLVTVRANANAMQQQNEIGRLRAENASLREEIKSLKKLDIRGLAIKHNIDLSKITGEDLDLLTGQPYEEDL